ncbi:MAG: 3-hydroxybutyrate dehydrogenase [Rickettsiales bacterium]|nr:3-hydroxybutyrate dehydrogenase [Rickettsiales bacterium]|tara:strand:- start:122 stop:916 length:795 start_codon:yes stop_codon:yes gene_type:complete
MSDNFLKGKVALVTGSTSGIGLAIAKSLASKGASIMLNGFGDADEIEQIRNSMEKDYGVKAFYNDTDLSKPEDIGGLISDVVEKLGALHILVNNAGIQYTNLIEDFDPKMWDKIIAINLSSVFHTMHHAMPILKNQDYGRIINIASAHGLVASVHKAGYIAAKHGVVGLTKVAALETAQTHITANTICPGWVFTPLVEKQVQKIADDDGISFEEAKIKLLSEKQPSKEFVKPEEIGALAVFLCQEEAKQITGSSYSIDGGWTAR